MIGAGTFISPLLKVITTVAILAAVYFFIVKPVLDTTESAFNAVSPAFEGLGEVGPSIRKSVREAQRLSERQQASSDAQVAEANKLLDCVTAASGNVDRIQRCNRRFDPANP